MSHVFEGIDGIIEATDFETLTIYKGLMDSKRIELRDVVSRMVMLPVDGVLQNTVISCRVMSACKKNILFWHDTSSVVYHDVIAAYLKESYPDVPKTNAMNSHNVLKILEE